MRQSRLGGLPRPHQVACIDGIHPAPGTDFARQPHRDLARLPCPGLVKGDIDMALDAFDAIPGRFAVTNENDTGWHDRISMDGRSNRPVNYGRAARM